MLVICGSDVVSWTTELDRSNIDVPWNTSLGYRYFIMCQVLPLLVRLYHKTYEHSDTIWMWRGYQTLCPWQGNYKVDRCSSGWYSDVLHDIVVGEFPTPTMERYTLGSRSIIMVFVIVWPDTWLSRYVKGTSIIWMSKEYMPGNEDNVIVSPRAM